MNIAPPRKNKQALPSSAVPSAEAQSVFFRSLSVMYAAGVTLDKAMGLLSKHTEDPKMSAIAGNLEHMVCSGVPLHTAFQAQERAFSDIQIGLVHVGERTGSLGTVLARLAEYEEKRRALNMKIRSALVYPLFLMIATFFMLVVLPPYMFEGLFKMLESHPMELPLITRIVIGASHVIRSPFFWLSLMALGAGAMAVVPRWLRDRNIQLAWSRFALQTPGLGRLYQILATTRFARALELQLEVGEGPLTGLGMAALSTGCPVLERGIARSILDLKNGATLVESLETANFFPQSFISMLSAGEESAELPDVLRRTADIFETELECAIEMMTNMLEPTIMLGMGILVGFVLVATMLPLVNMLQSL